MTACFFSGGNMLVAGSPLKAQEQGFTDGHNAAKESKQNAALPRRKTPR